MKISAKECRENNQKYLNSRKDEFSRNKEYILELIYDCLKDESMNSLSNKYTFEFILDDNIYTYSKYKGFRTTGAMYDYFDIDIESLDEIIDEFLKLGFEVITNKYNEEEDFKLVISW